MKLKVKPKNKDSKIARHKTVSHYNCFFQALQKNKYGAVFN